MTASIKNFLKSIIKFFLMMTPYKHVFYTGETQAPITPGTFFLQKIIGINRKVYWPVHYTSQVNHPENILIGIGTAPGQSMSCYISGLGNIVIGDYTQIGPHVGIISANHDTKNLNEFILGKVTIGRYCWLGMGSVILPNVVLGDHTTVAAGAIVTKSFPEGYCIIGGNPAKMIKKIDPSTVCEPRSEHEYYGYIPKNEMDAFRKKYLKI